MPAIPIRCDVVDAETGEVIETKTVPFALVPPAPDACQICGRRPACLVRAGRARLRRLLGDQPGN
jgi:hypothetical protein